MLSSCFAVSYILYIPLYHALETFIVHGPLQQEGHKVADNWRILDTHLRILCGWSDLAIRVSIIHVSVLPLSSSLLNVNAMHE